MATYTELADLESNGTLRNKIRTAVLIKAQTLIDLASPTAAQLAWASDAIANVEAQTTKLFRYVLAASSSATAAQIQNATDATIQTNVNAAVDKLITGNLI